ncbi:ShlB/FhaC/HecB family hemolysin secretion/activation protein [Azospirillum baldaniorum]|uniref:ShlB/FhaC/HecB family hemolysin secretion/activation protein n=1 Tax=Azospirillum baldaniorum TaxID=1064539 RepID=UPI001FE35A74|nr:ShlB/FhaC/HecB family hemolysin secretion/activation protein [Azospirillum baldaniorum]
MGRHHRGARPRASGSGHPRRDEARLRLRIAGARAQRLHQAHRRHHPRAAVAGQLQHPGNGHHAGRGTPLLASEQIALGGPSYGRAFDEGEISGDNGWAGSLELRYTPVLPDNAFAQAVQIYGFVDGGEVWNRSSLEQNSRNSLVSVGGGVRASLVERLFATLER